MYRVQDRTLSYDQLKALIGSVVKIEFSSYTMGPDLGGMPYTRVGIITEVEFEPRDTAGGFIRYVAEGGELRKLYMLGECANTLFFTTLED